MPVKRRSDRISDNISHVHLYLEDLRALEEIMRTLGGDEDTLEVSGENYEASNVDELSEVEPRTIRELTIRRRRPSVTVRVRGLGVSYSAEDSTDLEQQGAIARIRQIIEGAQRPAVARFLRHPWLASLLAPVIAVWGVAWMAASDTEAVAPRLPGLALVVTGILWVVLSYLYDTKFSAKATLAERADEPGFFSRNKDQLILVAISTVLGAAAGVVGTLLTQALTGS